MHWFEVYFKNWFKWFKNSKMVTIRFRHTSWKIKGKRKCPVLDKCFVINKYTHFWAALRKSWIKENDQIFTLCCFTASITMETSSESFHNIMWLVGHMTVPPCMYIFINLYWEVKFLCSLPVWGTNYDMAYDIWSKRFIFIQYFSCSQHLVV